MPFAFATLLMSTGSQVFAFFSLSSESVGCGIVSHVLVDMGLEFRIIILQYHYQQKVHSAIPLDPQTV